MEHTLLCGPNVYLPYVFNGGAGDVVLRAACSHTPDRQASDGGCSEREEDGVFLPLIARLSVLTSQASLVVAAAFTNPLSLTTTSRRAGLLN
jgi:hypothetical protein